MYQSPSKHLTESRHPTEGMSTSWRSVFLLTPLNSATQPALLAASLCLDRMLQLTKFDWMPTSRSCCSQERRIRCSLSTSL